MKSLPSVSLYIRITDEKGRRRYERIRRRNPQMCGRRDVYCLHFYEKDKRKWLSVGTDLSVANAARGQKEQELLLLSKEDFPVCSVRDVPGAVQLNSKLPNSGPTWASAGKKRG